MINVNETKSKPLRVIDFFCGAGGMTHGLLKSGLNVLGGIDSDTSCGETYIFNNPGSKFVNRDVTLLTPNEFADEFDVQKNTDDLVFVGCSPCQFWSKINTDRTNSKKTAYLLLEFQRFVEIFLPGFVVIENVPGLERKSDVSALPHFLQMLRENKYQYAHRVINAVHYGVPQNRKRYLLIASRINDGVTLPKESRSWRVNVRDFIEESKGFPKIEAGHVDKTWRLHTAAKLAPQNLRRIQATPQDGGDRMSWKDNSELQLRAYKENDTIFRDVYSRMRWDRPAPTITTRFSSFSNGRFGHPEQDRAISLRRSDSSNFSARL